MIRNQMRSIQIQGDYVRLLSHLDASGIRSSLCQCTVDGCHLDYRLRFHQCRIVEIAVVDHRGQMHLLEHIHVVVACTAVGSQGNPNTLVQHSRHRSESASELEVACRVVDRRHTLFKEEVHILFSCPNAVSRIGGDIEESFFIEPSGRSDSILCYALLVLALGFRKVDVKSSA